MKITMKNRTSSAYRFTFDKGEKEGTEALAQLRQMIARKNKQQRSYAKRYALSPDLHRVSVYGRCGKGNYNPRTQWGSVPPAEATRFDVYVHTHQETRSAVQRELEIFNNMNQTRLTESEKRMIELAIKLDLVSALYAISREIEYRTPQV